VSRGQYFDSEPTVPSDGAARRVTLTLPDLTVQLRTDRGVFSADRVDPGTRVLLGSELRPAGATLVDLGCGYGPIAAALAHRAPHATVWAVDTNTRARSLCADNLAALGTSNVRVVAPDEVPDGLRVNEIWSNPPIRIGKAALQHLLSGWLDRLEPEGRALLVVQKHLGADSLAEWLNQHGRTATRLLSRQGYRILEVHNDDQPATH